jgi:molecular chaperone DnaK
MYKAQAEAQQGAPAGGADTASSNGEAKEADNVEDVDFEEVK